MIALLAFFGVAYGAEIYRPHSTSDFGLGLSTIPSLTMTTTAFSGAWFRNENQVLELHLGLATDQSRFGVGVQYQWTVSGGPELGLHIGPGFGVGTLAGFAATFAGVAGIHLKPFGIDKIWITLDSGLSILVRSGAADFTLQPLSSSLGLGVFYRI